MKLRLLVCLIIGWPVWCQAAPVTENAMAPGREMVLKKTISLDTLVKISFERNPGLKAARAKWRAAIERYPQVTSLDDPTIGVDTWNIPTDLELDKTRNTIYWISQEFPFPGKLGLKGDIVVKEVESARLQLEIAVRDLVTQLKENYYELHYLDHSISIIGQNRKLAAQLAKISTTEFARDATTLNDILKAQSQLAQLENDLILLEELRMAQIAKINSLLDYPPGHPLGRPEGRRPRAFDWDLQELYRLALKHQPELMKDRAEIEKNRKKVELAQKRYYPDFKVTLKRFDNNGISQREGFGFLFGIKVPIWFNKNRARVREAENNLQAREYERKSRENRVNSGINTLYFKLRNSWRLIRLYRETLIPQSRKTLETAESWYRKNKGSFSGILEARSVWLNFNLAHHRARTDFLQNLARLERLIGVELKTARTGEGKNEQTVYRRSPGLGSWDGPTR